MVSPLWAIPMNIEDVLSIQHIKTVRLSPNGHRVVYLKNGVLWLSELQHPGSCQKLDEGSSPQWFPNSQQVAYLKQQDKSNQIFLYTVSTNQSVQVTTTNREVMMFKCSPDGKKIAYILSEPGYLSQTIWLLDVATCQQTKLTTANILTAFDWSPDGEKMVFSAQEGQDTKSKMRSKGYIYSIKDDFMYTFSSASKGGFPVFEPKWSSDGKWIYFLTTDGFNNGWLKNRELGALNVSTNRFVSFPETSTLEIVDVCTYSPQEEAIYYLVEEGFGHNLCRLSLKDGGVTPLTRGSQVWDEFSFSKDFSVVAFTKEDSQTPPELYASRFPQLEPQQVTTFNQVLKNRDLAQGELIHWNNAEGQSIEGLLMKPLGYVTGNRYPMVVYLHPGPGACFSNVFSPGGWQYPAQLLAAQGMLVLMPNPRGSTGYGKAFKRALINHWGEMDGEDVMAGLNYLDKEMKIVNPIRIGLAGWGYGGYLAAVLLSKPNPFRTASMGGAFTDLVSFYATVDAPDWMAAYLGGSPYKNTELYFKLSPLYRLAELEIPVLLQHGTDDLSVPVSQARVLYRELKSNHIPVTLVEYPNEGHELKLEDNKRNSIKLNVEWFKTHLVD